MNSRAQSLHCRVAPLLAAMLVLWGITTFPSAVLANNESSASRRPEVKVGGWVEDAGSGSWLVSGLAARAGDAGGAIDLLVDGSYAVVKGSLDDSDVLRVDVVSVLSDVETKREGWDWGSDETAVESPDGDTGFKVEFRGLIQDTEPQYWVVGNRLVFVTDRTSISGRPEIGALAEVKGTLTYGDIVLAKSIQVTLPDAIAKVEFEGVIESMTEDQWIVGGTRVKISPVTVVEGSPALDMIAEVQGVLQPDGSVLADHVSIYIPGLTALADIEGIVEQIEATQWIVAGRTVLVEADTFIDESRAPAEVGMWAYVRVVSERDGSPVALRIRLFRPL